MFPLNQWVRVNYHEIFVAEIEEKVIEPYKIDFNRPRKVTPPKIVMGDGAVLEPNPADDPDNPRLFYINVIYRNPHANESLNCRRNQWWLYDADGYSYEALADNDRVYKKAGKPFLGGSRQLNPGLKLRGWVAFELPRATVPDRLQFIDGFLSSNSVDFSLTSMQINLLPNRKQLPGSKSEE